MTVHEQWQARQRRRAEDAKRMRRRVPLPRDPKLPELRLYDVYEAGAFLNLSPSYVRKLCDARKLGYVVQTYRHGVFVRRVRKIPHAELLRYTCVQLKWIAPRLSGPHDGGEGGSEAVRKKGDG